MTVTVFGIRHHGPGSARSLAAELERLQPDAVLVEGPPEGEAVLALAGHEAMEPPVALLVYVPDAPRKAAFYPFAAFSPEWHAIRFGLARGVPVRFIDLPAAQQLAGTDRDPPGRGIARDPLGTLAAAAGYEDAERWWEDVVEHRTGDAGVFTAVGEAMAALRERAGDPPPSEARREAAMRRAIRAAVKEGFARIAVVCGAWHAPVLDPATFPSAASDAALLKGLPKVRVAATWVPWTSGRLAFESGYGAGVTSPGWYAHLFTAPDAPVTRWMQRVAALLRGEGLDASPASVVEAVRAAEALAVLRGRPLAGLPEVRDAALAALCGGDELRYGLVERRLVVGDALGGVPDETPMVPLAQDLERVRKTLRLKLQAGADVRELDLRRPLDLERSRLLHRLALLDVSWGEPVRSARASLGTFRESWRLEWEPELSVRLIEMSRWGTTVQAAATARAIARAGEAEELGGVTALAEACLLAALPEAVAAVMGAVQARAAHDEDVGHLMDALVPLARVRRYGSVRREDADAVGAVVDGLAARIAVGLGPACTALDDEAAEAMVARVGETHAAVATLERDDLRAAWHQALGGLLERGDVHGLLAGRAARLLLDAGVLDAATARTRLARALSRGADAAASAAWVQGFLERSGLVLLHDPALLGLVDDWLARVGGETFDALLPVLRRTFGSFDVGERRQIGDRVRREGRAGDGAGGAVDVDVDRAAAALPVVLALLGRAAGSGPGTSDERGRGRDGRRRGAPASGGASGGRAA